MSEKTSLNQNYANKRTVKGVLPASRPQPHNKEAEEAVLAAMLLEPSPCVDFVVEFLGTEVSNFHIPANQILFATILDLSKRDIKIDMITVSDELNKTARLESIGGILFLTEIQGKISTTANVEGWCHILRDYAILREMITTCTVATEKCYSADENIEALVDGIETEIYNIRNQHTKDEIISLKDQIPKTFENLIKAQAGEVEVGIPTGFADLDRYVIGLKKGEMFVLAARPSIGKTAFALNVVRNVILKGGRKTPVALFSLEMTTEQISQRILCTEAGVPISFFFDKTQKGNVAYTQRLTKAVTALKEETNLYIDQTAGLTIPDLRAKARRLKSQHDIQLIVIDYLQLMKAGGRVESRQNEVAEISSGIKKLAKDLDVPVLVLAQLNRDVERVGHATARPKLSSLRESGAIEQDADVVAFLHRDRDEAKNVDNDQMAAGLKSELIIEKNRNGQTGIINLTFHPNVMEFRTAARYDAQDEPPPLNN